MLAPYYKCNADQLFFLDESGNILLECMELRKELS